MRRCVEEDRDMIRRQTMMTQLLAEPRRMGGDGFLHHVQALDAAREAPGHGAPFRVGAIVSISMQGIP